jgi:hypothetical protein
MTETDAQLDQIRADIAERLRIKVALRYKASRAGARAYSERVEFAAKAILANLDGDLFDALQVARDIREDFAGDGARGEWRFWYHVQRYLCDAMNSPE